MRDKNLLVLAIFLFVGWGAAAMQARGALLVNIQDTFPVSYSALGLIAPAVTIGFIVSVLTIGVAMGRIDIWKFLLIGTGLSFLSFILVASSSVFPLLLGFFVITGVSSGFLTALSPPILGHMYSNKRGWIFNLHGMVWAIGAAFVPLFANLILGLGSWRLVYLLLGLGFIPIFLLLLKVRIPSSIKREKALPLKDLKSLGKHPAVSGMALAIAVNAGVEGAFFTWLAYYMTQFFPPNVANLILSGYLMAYIPGRLIYGRLSEKTGYSNLIFFNSVIIVLLLFLAFVVTSGFLMVACIFAIGFLISGNFPTLLAFGTNARPEYSGPINGIARSASALGLSIFPALIGVIADLSNLRNGMQLSIFLMIAVCVIIFAINRKNSKLSLENWKK